MQLGVGEELKLTTLPTNFLNVSRVLITVVLILQQISLSVPPAILVYYQMNELGPDQKI